jgi:hypothetical protein
MTTTLLIEIIFRGKSLITDFSFLIRFLKSCGEVRFNFPEVTISTNYEDIIKIFKSNSYVDFVITINELDILGRIVPNVFINLGLDDGKVELLFFLDLKDLSKTGHREGIDLLKDWAYEFKTKYRFDTVVCQMDSGNSREYYFDENGFGPLYNQLSC